MVIIIYVLFVLVQTCVLLDAERETRHQSMSYRRAPSSPNCETRHGPPLQTCPPSCGEASVTSKPQPCLWNHLDFRPDATKQTKKKKKKYIQQHSSDHLPIPVAKK